MNRWRLSFRVLAWNSAILCFSALIVEAIFGTWFFGESLGVLAVPRQVTIRHDVSRLYGGDVAVHRRDRFGFRGAATDPSKIDVLVVGGSTTAEFYVSEGETWVDVLAERFRHDGRPLGFANAGVEGFSTVGHLRSFEVWFPRVPGLQPRYVILYIGINDLDIAHHERYDTAIVAGRGDKDAGGRRLAQWLKNHSALNALYRTVAGTLRAGRVQLAHGAGPPQEDFPIVLESSRRQPDIAGTQSEAVAAYQARLRELDRRIRDLGATPIIVTQFRGDARWADGVVRAASENAAASHCLLMRFNAAAMETCREVRAICVDLASEIRFEAHDFYDAVHTTPQGSRRIADYLFGKLRFALSKP